MKSSIKEKRVLVTGSSKGIGYVIAKEYLRIGSEVIVTGRSNKNLIEAKKKITEENIRPINAFYEICDFEDIDSIKNLSHFSFILHSIINKYI